MTHPRCYLLVALLIAALSSCSTPTGPNSGQLAAVAGADRTVMSVTSVTLNGSGSTGDVVSYSWTQTSGTTVGLSDDAASDPTFAAPTLAPGTSEAMEFNLTVSDGSSVSTDTVTITVLSWKQVSVGLQHTMAVRSDGTLWAWGSNTNGQIGQGNSHVTAYADALTQVGSDSDWEAVAAGDYHNVALKTTGAIFAFGKNRYGQTGNGSSGTGAADVTAPRQVGSSTNWAAVDAREDQSFAIDASGNLYGWGHNNLDRLGLGEGEAAEVTAPTMIRAASAVSGGGITTLAIDGSTLWTWGNNAYGQFGVADTLGSSNVPDSANGLTDVVAVASGGQHSYVIRNNVYASGNDTLWSMGFNFHGELGTGDPATENAVPGEITAAGITGWNGVAAGKNHGLAVASDGTLWSWGYNNNGQLGLADSGAGSERDTAQKVGTDTDWYSVAAWFNHSAALKDDGTLWLWGAANYGAIGDASAPTDGNDAVNTPYRVGK